MAARVPLRQYAQSMAITGWGGAIEIASFAHRFQRSVHVFEKSPDEHTHQCIAQFTDGGGHDSTIFLLYQGRNHYDVRLPAEATEAPQTASSSHREAVQG